MHKLELFEQIQNVLNAHYMSINCWFLPIPIPSYFFRHVWCGCELRMRNSQSVWFGDPNDICRFC